MKANTRVLIKEFKEKELALEQEVKRIIFKNSPKDLSDAFFDGPEVEPFKRKESNLYHICTLVKGFTRGFQMRLEDREEANFFLKFEAEFKELLKENFDLVVNEYRYQSFDNPGGRAHRLIVMIKE